MDFLNENVRKITICARSRRWWNEEIREERKKVGKAKRKLRRWRKENGGESQREDRDEGPGERREETAEERVGEGEALKEKVREASKDLRNAIRRAKRRSWEEFLHKADGNKVWSVMTYTKPQRSAAVPTISHKGATADTHERRPRC